MSQDHKIMNDLRNEIADWSSECAMRQERIQKLEHQLEAERARSTGLRAALIAIKEIWPFSSDGDLHYDECKKFSALYYERPSPCDCGIDDALLKLTEALATDARREVRPEIQAMREAIASAKRHIHFLMIAEESYHEVSKSHVAWRKIKPAIDSAYVALGGVPVREILAGEKEQGE